MEEEESDSESSSDVTEEMDVPTNLKCVDFDWRNPKTIPRITQAIINGRFSDIQKLIEDGASVNISDNRGMTPLHEAATNLRCAKVAEELIEAGAYIEHQSVLGETPLMLAVEYGNLDVLEVLIKNGASVNGQNCRGFTALHLAAEHNTNAEVIVRQLAAAGANVSAVDMDHKTALHYAIEGRNLEIVRVLVDVGVDPLIRDYYERNAVVSACTTGNVDILELLLDKVGRTNNILNNQSPDGWTLLMEAVQFRNIDVVRLLIEYGADPTLQEGRGLLALHLAAHSGRADILKLILDRTPNEIIEATSTLGAPRNVIHTRSLLALAIDKSAYDCIELILSRDLSIDVLSCPVKMGSKLVSPISFLILFADSIKHGDEKLKMLELLLSKPELAEPTYDTKFKIIGEFISPISAVVSLHQRNHPEQECYCYKYLSLLLSKGALADNPKLFCDAIYRGFTSGLSLLLTHSNTHEPEQLLKTMWSNIQNIDHPWNGTETVTLTYLMDLSTDHSLTFDSSAKPPQTIQPHFLQAISKIAKSKRRPATLKRLARTSFRSYLHNKTTKNPTDFLKTVKHINAPKSVIEFLMYNDI